MRITEDIKIEYIDDERNAYIKTNDEFRCIGKILNHELDRTISVQLNDFGLKVFNL